MNDSTQKPRRGEFRGETHDGSHSDPTLAQDEDTQPPIETETEDVHMPTQKVRTWDVLQGHPIAQKLDTETQLALVCEYVDLYEDLQGMSLAEFIDSYFAADDGGAEAQVEEATSEVEPDEDEEAEPSGNEYDTRTKERPRVHGRYAGRLPVSGTERLIRRERCHERSDGPSGRCHERHEDRRVHRRGRRGMVQRAPGSMSTRSTPRTTARSTSRRERPRRSTAG